MPEIKKNKLEQIEKKSKENAFDAAPLAIIAGGGSLPFQLVEHCKKIERDFVLVGFKGQTDPHLYQKAKKSMEVRLGKLSKPVRFFKKYGAKEIVFIGSIHRPSFLELRPDWQCIKLALKFGFNRHGDDKLLRLIGAFLESESFILKGIHEFMPDLLMPKAALGKYVPDELAKLDIYRGEKLLRFLAPQDIGQGVVVQNEMILGIEAIEGTDKLIERCASYKRKGEGPVFVKMKKQGQDERMDLPTIGPQTIEQLQKGGYKGAALEAGAVLIVSIEEVIKKADKAGLFLYGI